MKARHIESRVTYLWRKFHLHSVCCLQSAQERREWKRFGDATSQQPEHSVTVQSREDVPFERTKAQKSTRDEKQQLTLASAMQSNDKNAVTAKYVQVFSYALIKFTASTVIKSHDFVMMVFFAA